MNKNNKKSPTIRFQCPRCQSTLEAPEAKARAKINCPKCKQRLQIPAPARNKTILAPLAPDTVPLLAGVAPAPAARSRLLAAIVAMLFGAALVGGGVFLGGRLWSERPETPVGPPSAKADPKAGEKVAAAGPGKKQPEQPNTTTPKEKAPLGGNARGKVEAAPVPKVEPKKEPNDEPGPKAAPADKTPKEGVPPKKAEPAPKEQEKPAPSGRDAPPKGPDPIVKEDTVREKMPTSLAGDVASAPKEIFQLLNRFRRSNQVPPAKPHPVLEKVAQSHADNMARQDKYGDDGKNGHILDGKGPRERAKEARYSGAVAENVTIVLLPNVVSTGAMNAWENSPKHRANMLESNYTEVGIGVAVSKTGRCYCCQLFGMPAEQAGMAKRYVQVENRTGETIRLVINKGAPPHELKAGGTAALINRPGPNGTTVQLLPPDPTGEVIPITLRDGERYAITKAGGRYKVEKLSSQARPLKQSEPNAQFKGDQPARGPELAPKPTRQGDGPKAEMPANEAESNVRLDAAVKGALTWIVKNQQADGGWAKPGVLNPAENPVTASLCGLALMASGGKYQTQVGRAAAYVQARLVADKFPVNLPPNLDQSNWKIAICGLFLLEYREYLAKRKVRTDPAHWKQFRSYLVNEAFKRMEPSGGWGHTARVPCLNGYVELEVMSNWMLAMLGAAQRQGAKPSQDKVAKALDFIENCCKEGEGAVGYSPRPGQKGSGCPCRTAGALFAFGLLDRQGHKLYPLMTQSWRDDFEDSAEAHGSAALGLLGSGLGARQLGDDDWQMFCRRFFPYILEHVNKDGSFRHTKGTLARSIGFDHAHGPAFNTGTYALLLQLDRGNLRYLGQRYGPAVPKPKRAVQDVEPLKVEKGGAASQKSAPVQVSVENQTGGDVAMSINGIRLPSTLGAGRTQSFGSTSAVNIRFTLDSSSVTATIRESGRYAVTIKDGKLKVQKLP